MSGYIGSPIKRVEDKRFLTGIGRYTDDIVLRGMTHVHFVRSDVAHANIISINTDRAKAQPGVVAVFTGADMRADGVNGIPTGWQIGAEMKEPRWDALAVEKVCHVGQAIVAIVAESKTAAKDAAELVELELDILDAVVDARAALEEDAPLLHDAAPGNISFEWELGDKGGTDAALAGAHHVTTYELINQRLIPNAMEPRSAIGDWDRSRDELTLYTSTQNPHLIRLIMCAFVLGIPEHKCRVIAPDVGGGFGSKIFHYPEEVFVSWASRKINRPIKWTAERSESFMTDAHGRDHHSVAEMGFDAEGHIVGLRVRTIANLGAYLSLFSGGIPTWLYGTLLAGQYKTPVVHVHTTGVFTTTTPVDAYRGAGRPEATFLLERTMDLAAQELGMDPAELRRKNFIPADAFPYNTPVVLQYDSGNYEGALDKALAMADYNGFREMQAKAREEGRLLGIGLSCYIEACGIAPSKVAGAIGVRAGLYESAVVRVQPTGKVQVFTGSHSHGQGHETAFAQVVADKLGLPMADIDIIHGDTSQIPFGMGTYGSRSLAVGGSAISSATDKIIEKVKKIGAHKLEANVEDVAYVEGKVQVKGTDRSVGFGELALTAYVPHNYPEGVEPGLEANAFYDPANFTFPFGTHICMVEVQPETGEVQVLRYVAVDDVGNMVNPMLVEGQIHGGVAQGIGQALYEGAVYDDFGNLMTATYMDYNMPKADHLPMIEVGHQVTPCPHNPLGVKGAGEAGCIAGTAAAANAVMDAVAHLGIRDIPMPFTPEKMWRAIQEAQA